MWRSFGGLSIEREKGENGGKGTGIKKYKLVGTEQMGMLRIAQEMEKPKNLYVRSMDMN